MIADKISQAEYENLKNQYLEKNRSMHSLYIELNRENQIPKQLFFKLINKIRQEEGLSEYYTSKKQKKKNNIIDHQDKAPHLYN